MTLSKKNNIILIGGLFAVAACLLVIFLIYPSVVAINVSATEIANAKQQLASTYDQNKALEDFKDKAATYQPNLEKIDGIFIDTTDPIDFIKFLEATASQSHLTSDINLDVPDKSNPNELFHVLVKGGFPNVAAFAKKVENGPYLLAIKSVIVTKLIPDPKDTKPILGVSADFSIEPITQ